MTFKLETIVKETHNSPDSVVIWLHGLGADGSDFLEALPYLNLVNKLKIRFIFPCAPLRPVTINNGIEMPSWYDIKAMTPARIIDSVQLKESVNSVNQIISDQLAEGISLDRIMLVGFSQGGALAYEVALASEYQITAVAAMSTYLPRLNDAIEYSANKDINILSIHGDVDNVVPFALGEQSMRHLKRQGFAPKWHAFHMAHELSIDSLAVLGAWISKHLVNK